MRVYIVVDMEGISGIVNIQQVSSREPAFTEGRELLAGDVNAAVAGAYEAGAERVVVSDFHDSRRNFPITALDERAEYEVPYGRLMPALTGDFDAVLIVGMHARSGTPRAFLEHSVEPAWHQLLHRRDGAWRARSDRLHRGSAGCPCCLRVGRPRRRRGSAGASAACRGRGCEGGAGAPLVTHDGTGQGACADSLRRGRSPGPRETLGSNPP